MSQAASLGALGLLSIQIALVDVLKEEYGIVPDGMLGHSAGNLSFQTRHPFQAMVAWSCSILQWAKAT